MKDLKKYLAEFIGTFVLVLVACGVAVVSPASFPVLSSNATSSLSSPSSSECNPTGTPSSRSAILRRVANGTSSESVPDLLKRRIARDAHGSQVTVPAEPLAAGNLPDLRAGKNRDFRVFQGAVKQPQAFFKAPADQRAVLDRAGNVHGKGQDRPFILLQQFPLCFSPLFPGCQHFRQCHFPHQ